MVVDLAYIVAGGALLYYGADWLVTGAAGLARRLGVSATVVGLTVVAYGTSAPEMVVSSVAALEGNSAIALGNVVGSNIANLALILGATALLTPLPIERRMGRREVPVMLLTSALVPLFLLDGVVSRIESAVLVLGAVAYTVATLRSGAAPTEEAGASIPFGGRLGRLSALTALGLLVLVAGGKVFVDGASGLAKELGISQRVIGLTVVAVGTSLPEMATSLMAAWRRQAGIAVGNLVGSNIFNALAVLGVAGVVRPVEGDLRQGALDFAALGVVSLLTFLFLRTERTMARWEGAVLLLTYVLFLALLGAHSR